MTYREVAKAFGLAVDALGVVVLVVGVIVSLGLFLSRFR